ncbi:MAG: ATP-binding protein [Gemmataceae bacterium]
MPPDTLPIIVTIPSRLDLLPVARTFVASVCQVFGIDAKTTDAIVLAVNEAISNVIRHAHHDRPQAMLQIHCLPHADSLEIHILDEGAPFDLDAVPELDPGELRIGGRGVFLMRALMDEVSCQPLTPHGNRLRLLKRYHRRGRLPEER